MLSTTALRRQRPGTEFDRLTRTYILATVTHQGAGERAINSVRLVDNEARSRSFLCQSGLLFYQDTSIKIKSTAGDSAQTEEEDRWREADGETDEGSESSIPGGY
jgi:hypothetical protein